MNIEEILAECRKGRIAIDDKGLEWSYEDMINYLLRDLDKPGWSLAPIKREITLEQLELAWNKNMGDFKYQGCLDLIKKELGF